VIEYLHVKGEALEMKTEHETGHDLPEGNEEKHH
jgi:hypothetical protein